MADPNVAAFRLRFAEFSNQSDASIAFAIEEAQLIIGTLGTPNRALALLYMAAHIMSSGIESASNQGQSGTVVSDSMGRISQTASNLASSMAVGDMSELQTTYYGRRYKQVIRVGQSPMIMIGSGGSA
jgi:hypothetical protein